MYLTSTGELREVIQNMEYGENYSDDDDDDDDDDEYYIWRII